MLSNVAERVAPLAPTIVALPVVTVAVWPPAPPPDSLQLPTVNLGLSNLVFLAFEDSCENLSKIDIVPDGTVISLVILAAGPELLRLLHVVPPSILYDAVSEDPLVA